MYIYLYLIVLAVLVLLIHANSYFLFFSDRTRWLFEVVWVLSSQAVMPIYTEDMASSSTPEENNPSQQANSESSYDYYVRKIPTIFRDNQQAPIRKLSTTLIKTYKNINEVRMHFHMLICIRSTFVGV